MSRKSLLRWLSVLAVLLAVGASVGGEDDQGGGSPTNFGVKDGGAEDPREWRDGRYADFPTWKMSKEAPDDNFTFARLRHNSASRGRFSRHSYGKWPTDYPDSDMNLALRLQQLTSLQVNPKGAIVDIDAEQLRHYPFVYMIEVGQMMLTEPGSRDSAELPPQRRLHHG